MREDGSRTGAVQSRTEPNGSRTAPKGKDKDKDKDKDRPYRVIAREARRNTPLSPTLDFRPTSNPP